MKWIGRHKLLAAVALVSLCWLAPYADALLDDPADKSQNKCPQGRLDDPLRTARPNFNGQVRKIRLTDSGAFVDRCELTHVLYELNWDHPRHPNESRPDRKPEAQALLETGENPPKLVVLYIHGWKHSASSGDRDLEEFSKLINKLADEYKTSKQVLGVYIGWNAASKIPPLSFFPFSNLTFWSKKTIADRIAQSAVTTKIISAINAMLADEKATENQFIVIGHSFGARLLFSATGQSLIYDTEKSHPGYPGGTYKKIRGIANAVILLNPAFEASMYTSFDAVARIEEKFDSGQLPLVLSISSACDWATRIAFPIGQWLGFSRSTEEMMTLGNYVRYQTHTLAASDGAKCATSASSQLSERFVAGGLCLFRDLDIRRSEAEGEPPHVIQPWNPFLIARTTCDVIKDHNDIWNKDVSEWLSEYIKELGKLQRARLG